VCVCVCVGRWVAVAVGRDARMLMRVLHIGPHSGSTWASPSRRCCRLTMPWTWSRQPPSRSRNMSTTAATLPPRKWCATWAGLGAWVCVSVWYPCVPSLVPTTALCVCMCVRSCVLLTLRQRGQRQIFRKADEERSVFTVTASYQETGLFTHLFTPNVVRHAPPSPWCHRARMDNSVHVIKAGFACTHSRSSWTICRSQPFCGSCWPSCTPAWVT
jgi:hypothetical protein